MAACALATAGSSAAGKIPMAADSMAMAAVPADGRITITDYGCRDWGPELVHYRLDTAKFRPGRLVLLDEAGRAVPFQIDDGVLAFVAAAAKGKTTTYALRASPTDRSAENSMLKAAEQDAHFEMTNGLLSLRMPLPGRKTYSPSADASTVLAPIAAWAGSDGRWMGAAAFATPRKIRSHRFRVLRRGPAVVEYEARYTFAPKGRYVWRVRLSPGMPIAVVTEEFDVGEVTRGEDMVLLDLHKGWRPQSLATSGGQTEQHLPELTRQPLGAYVRRQKKSPGTDPPVGGVGNPPRPVVPAEGMVLLAKIVPGGKWGGYKGCVQVYDGDQPGTGRNIAFVPLFTGSWRRAMAVNAWHQARRGVVLSLPISVRYMRWSLDIADDFSPFSTHEHDPGLPATFGRRVWGLYVGAAVHLAQARFGYIGLDRYKDWIIEYPDTTGAKAYPGGFFSPGHVARIRKTLNKHPDREFLKRWYLVSGRTEDAVGHAKMVIKRLTKPYGQNDFFLVGLSNYRKSQFLAFVNRAEDALACPELPKDLRAELRRRLALHAHVTSEPDFNPRGSGVHLGNNNMTINRTLALTYFACLLPDHPRYAYWISRAAAYAQFKLATQTGPSGAWVACPSYQTYSPLRTLNITQIACRNRGVADFAATGRHAATLMYLANLTMADPRYDGRRIIPGMGNSANLLENVWGFCMAAVADGNPRVAGRFRYFNRLANRDVPMEKGPNYHDDTTAHPMYYLPDIPEDHTPLKTTFMPVYGVAFRNHFGHPNETAMLFRAAMGWSHWDSDYLNVILYGRGAPLSPGTGYQYYSGPATKNNAVYHNQVKVGRRDLPEVFGRVDGGVVDYGFGARADYALAERFYPSQLFRDGRGAMSWRRHVIFLKSPSPDGPSYFVMRDTFPGGEARKKWWTWLNLGPADRIQVDGKAFDAAATPLDKVVPVRQMPAMRGRVLEMDSGHGASTWIWFDRPVVARVRLTFRAANETKTIVEVDAAGGEDFFYVVAPLAQGERPPRCEELAGGTLRIRTAEGADVVFLADEPLDYHADGIVFTGKAGAVRSLRDRVGLCMSAGSGKIGYGGYVLRGHGPFERTIKLADLKGGTHRVPGGYEKKIVTVDLGRGVAVTGEGPFEAVLEGDVVRIKTRGRQRVLRLTQPPFLIRPQYFIDGVEWMACWTDYPASGWGKYDNTWQIGLSVPAGTHGLLVRDMVFPEGWTRPFGR
jgi:hypothetical protein